MIPMPPSQMLGQEALAIVPAHDLGEWVVQAFVEGGAPLANEDHAHLRAASIGFLWAGVENARKGRKVIGLAEPGMPQGAMGKWARARAIQQVEGWFGSVPDFIITVDVGWWVQAGDAERCALIEHELYHCAQDRDEFGSPKFNASTGRPTFTMRGHDVEEFVGVVRRYGADATGIQALIAAASQTPEIAAASIAQACGTCLRAA